MPLEALWARGEPVNAAFAARRCAVGQAEWLLSARAAASAGGRLLALWISPDPADAARCHVRAALITHGRVLLLELALAADGPPYRGLQEIFPVAARMQRAAADLTGVRASDPDLRPWLRHAAWPASYAPLSGAAVPPPGPARSDDYRFVRVDGEGVHEIAVGPVHAGIIEPGHFRFSVVGEKVLRLEERLGYVHKGIERRFTELRVADGHRLAARVSGDSTVAYGWAYCQAAEACAGIEVPPRALWLRALALELERIQNHLGDLGALGNDAGFAFGLTQFLRLKEQLLRACEAAFGQRYLFDIIVPGGTARDADPGAAAARGERVAAIAVEAAALRAIYDSHTGVRDRFVGAGAVTPELALRLGLTGLAGRASGQGFDARIDLALAPYADLKPRRAVDDAGDVAARVAVRFEELAESCRLVGRILAQLPAGPYAAPYAAPPAGRLGCGLVEGWRGPVFVALECGPGGAIHRCHPHDPSWHNWPVLEHAIIGNIVPDFPLINKSFNLSYSGHDL
jgi:Ni,Fe-hydrogenase III large subunit